MSKVVTLSMPDFVHRRVMEKKPKELKNNSEWFTEILLLGIERKEQQKNQNTYKQSMDSSVDNPTKFCMSEFSTNLFPEVYDLESYGVI